MSATKTQLKCYKCEQPIRFDRYDPSKQNPETGNPEPLNLDGSLHRPTCPKQWKPRTTGTYPEKKPSYNQQQSQYYNKVYHPRPKREKEPIYCNFCKTIGLMVRIDFDDVHRSPKPPYKQIPIDFTTRQVHDCPVRKKQWEDSKKGLDNNVRNKDEQLRKDLSQQGTPLPPSEVNEDGNFFNQESEDAEEMEEAQAEEMYGNE